MIAFEFEYHRPTSIPEAVRLFHQLDQAGKEPQYYAGGAELICRARSGSLHFGAVIDIKQIADCTVLALDGDQIRIGAAIPLSQAADANLFPLLGQAARGIADRTVRNRMTIGGNMAGSSPYRESLLPFLAADSRVLLAGENGTREVPLRAICGAKLQLASGELLLQVITAQQATQLPFVCRRRTRGPAVDYPLATVVLLQNGPQTQGAFAGISPYPFRTDAIDRTLSDTSLAPGRRAATILEQLPGPVPDDFMASADYRRFVFQTLVADAVAALEGVARR